MMKYLLTLVFTIFLFNIVPAHAGIFNEQRDYDVYYHIAENNSQKIIQVRFDRVEKIGSESFVVFKKQTPRKEEIFISISHIAAIIESNTQTLPINPES